jgi:hypothetical protein
MGKSTKATMNSSAQRGTFHHQCAVKRAIEDGVDPDTAESVKQALDIELMFREQKQQQEADPEWQKNNLEYDLRSNSWICDKAKAREEYAQNLYAAMCNNDFQKLDVWPLLKGETYSCSWRYAGGIVADMRETGDYMDWYCTGIRGGATEEQLAAYAPEDLEKYHWYEKYFVGEGTVTEEIEQDLLKLGWKVVQDQQDQTL